MTHHPADRLELESTRNLLDEMHAGNGRARGVLVERHVPRLARWARGRLPLTLPPAVDLDRLVRRAIEQVLAGSSDELRDSPDTFQARTRERLLALMREELIPGAAALDQDNARGVPFLERSLVAERVGEDRLDRYERALQRLAWAEREAVFARIELGLSYEDIARELRQPSDEVRAVVQRAVETLARRMAEDAREQP